MSGATRDDAGRRWPLVTIGLIVVNLVCLIAFDLANAAAVAVYEAWRQQSFPGAV